jgi:hypothetical protein
VDRHAGVLDFPGEVIIPMDGCDHRTVCRFSDEKDSNYRVIMSRIRELIGQYAFTEKKIIREQVNTVPLFLIKVAIESA